MDIKVEVSELKALTRKLASFPGNFDRAHDELLDETGQDLLQTTVRHASGRPGPRIITGQYVSAFYVVRNRWSVEVRNDSPQSRRLEYGFYGTDSMGRVYHQPAFPHMAPARAEVMVRYRQNLRDLPGEVWRST